MRQCVQNGVVYNDYENGVICCIGRWAKEIQLVQEDGQVKVLIFDWQGKPLSFEPVTIRITGESAQGETLEPFEGECDDGTIELDGYETGDAITIETLNQNVENASLEVVV